MISHKRFMRADEQGTALVEFALILPILIALLFGVIEFGFAFNSNLEVRSASREGARLAAVDNGCGSGTSCSSPGVQRDNLIVATRAKATGLANRQSIKISVSLPNGTQAGKDAEVCLNYTLQSKTGLFSPVLNNVVLKSKAVMRLEQDATFSEGTDTGGPGAASC
jgi:hypothetical protein